VLQCVAVSFTSIHIYRYVCYRTSGLASCTSLSRPCCSVCCSVLQSFSHIYIYHISIYIGATGQVASRVSEVCQSYLAVCDAVCCSVFQRVVVFLTYLYIYIYMRYRTSGLASLRSLSRLLQCDAVFISSICYVAVCVAVRCSVLQCVAV